MNERLSKIYIDNDMYSAYSTGSKVRSLDNLSRVNIFIGQNNSGKSRLLRKLFSDESFEFRLSNMNLSALNRVLEKVIKQLEGELLSRNISDVANSANPVVLAKLKEFQKTSDRFNLSNVSVFASQIVEFWNSLLNFTLTGASGFPEKTMQDSSTLNVFIRNLAVTTFEEVKALLPPESEYKPERVYIPVLRGLRSIQLGKELRFMENFDNYHQRTVKDYFPGHKGQEKIFTGLNLYEDIKRLLLGKQKDRQKIKNFELFLSKEFFRSEQVSLIPNIDDDSLHISFGKEERPIYDVGDGIQNLIVLLYPLFANQGKNMLFYIEEPETSMHPGLQRLFLETLMKEEFESYQYFITTHSNHLLDITLDLQEISVYSLRKSMHQVKREFEYEIVNNSNEDKALLDLIGVRNSSVFLSNCTIWVEGITDRLYIKKYLELYQEKLVEDRKLNSIFREDYHFSFVEYGGGNVVHFSFSDCLSDEDENLEKINAGRLSSKILLIVDEDNTFAKPNSAKANRFDIFKKQLGDNFVIVGGCEIENTVSLEILSKTLEVMEDENWDNVKFKISEINAEEFRNQKIGSIIVKHFVGLKRNYKADSGTILPKLEFCRTSIKLMDEFEDLSQSAKDLAEKIFLFIQENNSNSI